MKRRRFYGLLVAAAAVAFVAGAAAVRLFAPQTASAADAVSDVITAKDLAVVDGDGGLMTLVSTGEEDGAPMIAFYEGEGVVRAVYSLTGAGEPTVVMNDVKGELRLVFGVTDSDGPGALMLDNKGKNVWSVP